MALTFPISASIGQTYQSGSSNTYEWTGTYWKIKNVINFNAFSASVVNRIDNISVSGGNIDSSSFATTGSNTFIGNQTISGSITLQYGAIISETADNALAFGLGAGVSQQNNTIAIGTGAGITQNYDAIAIGTAAAGQGGAQGQEAIAIGITAGGAEQGMYAIAIGSGAGQVSQSMWSVAIGYDAGRNSQTRQTIILNATGDVVDSIAGQSGSFYVAPIRKASGISGVLQYNSASKEITYSNSISGSISITGSLTVSSSGTFTNIGPANFIGNQTITGSLIVTEIIKGTGSIYLQPDINDARKLQIYNTAGADTHIKATGGLTFLGNDINNVKIDDYYKKISIDTPNGVYVSSSLNIKWDPSSLSIGDSFQGGKIAYLYTPGDGGYNPNLVQGVIAAEADEPTPLAWDAAILAVYNKTTNEYDDWYLPNKVTLDVLYDNKVAIGGFTNNNYWSSTDDPGVAWYQHFANGAQFTDDKLESFYVRACRNFSIPINALNIDGKTVLSGSLKVSGSTTINGPLFLEQGFILGTGSNSLTILSQDYSIIGTADVNNYPSGSIFDDGAIFITTRTNYPISNRLGAQTQIKSGSNVSAWYYDADGTSYLPGDVNIGFDAPLSEYLTSGSLNIKNGNINLSGSMYFGSGSSITETSSSIIITPAGAAAGQSLVVRQTGIVSLSSDHPLGFYLGDTITLTFSPYGSAVSGTAPYVFTGCTQAQLGTSLSGSLIFDNEIVKTLTWTIPALSDISGFTFEIYNFAASISQSISLSSSGSSEQSHIHLVSGDPSLVDIYLGDDDQYVKIEKNAGDVVIGTNNNTKHWRFDTSGSLDIPQVTWNYITQTFTAIPVTYGATELTFTVLPDNTITNMSVAYGAGGYTSGSINLTIPGTTFSGGTTPANDIVFNIQTFESAGPVYSTDPTSAISYVSGTPPQRYDNIASTGVVGIGAGNKHWTFDTSGSFNTPGDINITGSVKLSTTNQNGDSVDLIIGNTNDFGPNGYQIKASGSTENALFLISNLASLMVAQGTVSNPGDTSLFATQVVGYVNNGGPEAQLQLSKSGSVPAIWVYDYTATSNFPGDINIGYDNIIGTTSGSLNIRNGNINVTGSVNIDNAIKLKPVTNFPNGEAGMLVASASYGKTNLYMYDGSNWKWLVTGSIA